MTILILCVFGAVFVCAVVVMCALIVARPKGSRVDDDDLA